MSTAKQEKTAPATSFLGNLFQSGLYKRNQGRIARQVTFAAIWITVSIAAWRLSVMWISKSVEIKLGIPALLFAAGFWVAYRMVNLPKFADFLISVEAEMSKVSWPTRIELVRGSMVVLFMIFFLAAALLGFDAVWNLIFDLLYKAFDLRGTQQGTGS